MNTAVSDKYYYGKIMLFGEYSVITGSSAYLIPYRRVRAHFEFPSGTVPDKTGVDSNSSLKRFAGYLAQVANNSGVYLSVDLPRFNTDLEDGLFLNSTIPPNYGLGSSGALCAAVYDRYGIYQPMQRGSVNDTAELRELKKIFSAMESFFHGYSSGVDPLCIYVNTAIKMDPEGNPAIVKEDADNYGGLYPFLINTNDSSHTGPLVEGFRGQMNDPAIRNDFISHYVPLVNRAVEQLVSGELNLETVLEISSGQMIFLSRMIPEKLLKVWSQGIETGLYGCKLCGSGGGGMILGFTHDLENTRDYLRKKNNLTIEPIHSG